MRAIFSQWKWKSARPTNRRKAGSRPCKTTKTTVKFSNMWIHFSEPPCDGNGRTCYYINDPCPPGTNDCSSQYSCAVQTNKCCCPGTSIWLLSTVKYWVLTNYQANCHYKDYCWYCCWYCFPFSVFVVVVVQCSCKVIDWRKLWRLRAACAPNEIKFNELPWD